MSVTYSAYAVIGVRIDREKLFTKKTSKAFLHNYPAEMKFCPQTGKKLWEEEKKPIPQYNEDDQELSGFKVVDARECFVGRVAECGSYGVECSRLDLPPHPDFVKSEMKAVLEPLGLWDEKEFGIWSVIYCCYEVL